MLGGPSTLASGPTAYGPLGGRSLRVSTCTVNLPESLDKDQLRCSSETDEDTSVAVIRTRRAPQSYTL